MWRGKGRFGEGGGGTLAGTEDSPPPGPRGWDSRAPILLGGWFDDGAAVFKVDWVELEAQYGRPNVLDRQNYTTPEGW